MDFLGVFGVRVVENNNNCGGCNIVCTGEERCIDSACHGPKRAFVTNSNQSASFGGVAAADAKCQMEADGQSLGGTWLAWVSDSSTAPATRFARSPAGYKRLDDVVIADEWGNLVDGNIDVTLDVTPTGAITTNGATYCFEQ
jgi:hypothetical protein